MTSGFLLSAGPARGNKSGLLLYTEAGRAASPFSGGTLCVATPLRRSLAVSSGGTNGQCDGTFSLDMNAFASGGLGGNPSAFLSLPGVVVDVQWWGRDTIPTGAFLSNALEYRIQP